MNRPHASGQEVAWTGKAVIIVQRLEGRSLFTNTWLGNQIRRVLPELKFLCSSFGWGLFTITWVPGPEGWATGLFYSERWLATWLAQLGEVVGISFDRPPVAPGSPQACHVHAEPRFVAEEDEELTNLAACVVRTDPVLYASRWAKLAGRPSHRHRHCQPACAALVLARLARDTMLYVRALAYRSPYPPVLFGAYDRQLGWHALFDKLRAACTLYGFTLLDESTHPAAVLFRGPRTVHAPPSYPGQPVLVVRSARGGVTHSPPHDTSPAKGGPVTPWHGRVEKGWQAGAGHQQDYPHPTLRSQVLTGCKSSRTNGPFVAYLLIDPRAAWGRYRPVTVPTGTIAANTIQAASLTALGWLVAPGGYQPVHDGFIGSREAWALLCCGAARGAPSDQSLRYRCRMVDGRVLCAFGTRDLRWAPTVIALGRRQGDCYPRYPPRRFGRYVRKYASVGSCFVVEPRSTELFLEHNRLRMLSRCLALRDGLSRILRERVLAVVTPGLILVHESAAERFESAVRAAAWMTGARVDWSEVADPDDLLR